MINNFARLLEELLAAGEFMFKNLVLLKVIFYFGPYCLVPFGDFFLFFL